MNKNSINKSFILDYLFNITIIFTFKYYQWIQIMKHYFKKMTLSI